MTERIFAVIGAGIIVFLIILGFSFIFIFLFRRDTPATAPEVQQSVPQDAPYPTTEPGKDKG